MCEEGIAWIYNTFGDCIVTTTDKISFSIGLISDVFWVLSAAPEIITVFRTKSVEGISPFLFSLLCFGDTLSLIGNILNGGLVTQIITCVLFVSCDVTCFAQYLYYKFLYKGRNKHKHEPIDKQESSMNAPLIHATSAVILAGSALAIDYGLPYRGKGLLGQVFGWMAATIATSSRIPQVILNFKRRLVSNLSPYYFVCTISGNITYFLSLIIRNQSAEFLWKETPWILECLAPLTFDIITVIQMCVYGVEIDTHGGEKPDPEQYMVRSSSISLDSYATIDSRALLD